MLKMKTLVATLLMVFAVNLTAQQMQPLPLDPKIRYGKLDNGLTYTSVIIRNRNNVQNSTLHKM